MREKTIEAKLVKAVRIMGGLAPKFVSPGFDGVPDRLVLLPKGKIAFIELKAPGGRASDNQKVFRYWCELHGVKWAECYTAQEGLDTLKSWGVL